MAKSDEFIVYDSCQYTVNDWRNRNQVKTHDGVRWITVPVITKDRFGQRITEAEVVDHKWVKTHLGTLTASLEQGAARQGGPRAPRRVLHRVGLDPLAPRDQRELSSSRSHAASDSAAGSPTTPSTTSTPSPISQPSAKVAELVRRAGGTRYLTGPRGLDYLDPADFSDRRHRDRRARLLDAGAVPADLRRLRRPPVGRRSARQRRARGRDATSPPRFARCPVDRHRRDRGRPPTRSRSNRPRPTARTSTGSARWRCTSSCSSTPASSSFTGGYIGVDVFFVLSGYLVTQLLLRDVVGVGRIRFGRFYSRRFRRLLPAAFVALIVTAIVFTAISSPVEVAGAVGSFKAAFLYVANWYFIHHASGYFGADISTNPVLHLLVARGRGAVLPAVAADARRRCSCSAGASPRRHQMRAIQIVVAVGAVASAAWALALKGQNPEPRVLRHRRPGLRAARRRAAGARTGIDRRGRTASAGPCGSRRSRSLAGAADPGHRRGSISTRSSAGSW